MEGVPRNKLTVSGCLLALIVMMATARVYAAGGGPETSTETSTDNPAVLSSGRDASPFIVIGFLGGFVPHNDASHPEVRLIEGLRQEYPGQYFDLFENRKVGEAYKTILRRLGTSEDGRLPEEKKRRARILLFGHSWGASAVVALSRKLERTGIPVQLTVQVDSVAKPFHNDRVIPPNVLEAANFYQTHGLVHGQPKIKPADPSRTTVLGNFRWEYQEAPAECRDFSWYARFFTKSHIAIECDPKVWQEVKSLLRKHLPEPAITETDAGVSGVPVSGDTTR